MMEENKNKYWIKKYNELIENISKYEETSNDLSFDEQELNRFKNVFAIKSTRVKINCNPGLYINANHINGIHDIYNENKSHYIATQAPIRETIHDFWVMVWENNINIIVMLVNPLEGYYKVTDYWKNIPLKREYNIDIDIELICEIENKDFTLREIKITDGNKEKIVYQYNYTSWPDQGVPKSIESFSNFISLIQQKEKSQNKNNSPIIVHCSAGVGRTGCYILIDTILKYIEEKKEKNKKQMVQVYNDEEIPDPIYVLKKLRKQRIKLVQTGEQFLFCIKVIENMKNQKLKLC